MNLTQKELKEFVTYLPEEGLFVSKKTNKPIGFLHNSRSKKDIENGKSNKFYIKLEFGRKRYYAHRLAWLYVYGSIPISCFQIDHIDGDGTNNKISNLRLVSQSENNYNRTNFDKRLKKGSGVLFDKRSHRWIAKMITRGKSMQRSFTSKEEAIKQRKSWEEKYGVQCTSRYD